jgi:predicted alpha-1,6-mannanase (GH76 family)
MTNFKTLADIAQKSIDYFYASPDKKQFMNNVYPLKNEKENEVFNYWWLAHLVDVRIDAYSAYER